MKIFAIMATAGRHTLSERSVRFFLDQDYIGEHGLLIYNNSPVSQAAAIELNDISPKEILMINQHLDSVTGQPYTNLGAIYRDAVNYLPDDVEVVYHHDDDDLFLPNHISEGVEGLLRAREKEKIAYKPERSYYRYPGGIQLMGNNLEPSVFVLLSHIQKHGYSLTTSDQHMPWFNSLLSENLMLVDPHGPPTLIYNWGDVDIPTFKTSGNAGHPNNFDNYRNFSKDHGDGILTPWSKESIQKYYNLIQ